MIDKMGDLHSIANYSGCCSSSSSSLGWNQYHHNLEVFNTNMSHSCSSNTPPYLSSFDNSDYSTGYLQDALFEFSSKRRRLLLFSDHQTNYSTSCTPIQNCSIYREDDLSYLINEQTNNTDTTVSGNYMIMNNNNREMETFEEKARPAFEVNCTTVHSSSSSSLNSKLQTAGSISDQTLDSLGDGDEKIMKRKKIMTRVVFPFGVVKPGGIDDGDMTLNDINERILMPPTRPVKHPVGEFACQPVGRLGLSGKPVVALTTIQTQGKGTITIIRTKNN